MEILVKTLAGLEPVLAQELEALGAHSIQPLTRGVQCQGDKRLLYRINLEARTALRALTPIHAFRAEQEEQLYEGLRRIDWTERMRLSDTLAVDAVVNSARFRHSHYVALRSKDAIVDQWRDRTGRRPSVDTKSPRMRINVHIRDDQVSVALDSSGESLHRRGYRQIPVEAPINEVLAAGILHWSGWDGQQALVDPMCGSGTFPIEAARMARHIPPQWTRQSFGFQHWRDFDRALWQEVRAEAESRILPESPAPIFAFDQDMRAIRATRRNAAQAGVAQDIHIQRRPFERLQAPAPAGVLVMNPPYDERLPVAHIESFYRQIGDHLKQQFTGYQAWVLSSHKPALQQIGLRASTKVPLYNGALACTLAEFDLYQGTRERSSGDR